MSRLPAVRRLAHPTGARRLALAFLLAAVGCGARTGLEDPQRLAIDAGVAPPPRDSGFADAGLADASLADAGAAPRCPFYRDERVSATLRISVDDNARVFLHGELIDETPRIWSEIGIYTVSLFRHPERTNVLAIEGINLFRVDGRDRGVLVDLRAFTDVGEVSLGTDARWRLQSVEEPRWFEIDHDESSWIAPTIEGPHGMSPWGALFGVSEAEWLWSYDSDLPVAAKPERERVFLRRRFSFDVEGRLVDSPTPCP